MDLGRELGQAIADLKKRLARVESALRRRSLGDSSLDDAVMTVKDSTGASRTSIGGANGEINSNSMTAESENFITGEKGWRVDREGNAELNDVTVRGEFRTGDTGERLVIPDGEPELRAYPATGDRYATLVSTTANVDGSDSGAMAISGPPSDRPEGNTGYAYNLVSATDSSLNYYDSTNGAFRANFQCFNTGAIAHAPVLQLEASEEYYDANPRRVTLLHRDSAGNFISNSEMQYVTLYAEERPVLRSPAGNVGIVWSTPEQDIAIVTWDGSAYRPIRASDFIVPSSRGAKINERPLPDSPSAVIRAAPAKMWERPPSPARVVPRTIYDRGGEPIQVPIDISAYPAKTGIGPMAEDLPSYMQEKQSGDEGPAVSVDKKVGELWGFAGEVLDRLDAIEKRLTALEQHHT